MLTALQDRKQKIAERQQAEAAAKAAKVRLPGSNSAPCLGLLYV